MAGGAARGEDRADLAREGDLGGDRIVRRGPRGGGGEQRDDDRYRGAPGTVDLGCATGENSKPVYCISSHVWSPHFTSASAFGLLRLPCELSYQAVETILAPFGTWSGSLNM